jgi:anti-sigma factor ChrR (cupin superfamily)
MTSGCEACRESLALFVLGVLEEPRSACEVHLETCASCRDEAARLRLAVEDLVLAGPHVDPTPALWPRIRDRIRRDSTRERPRDARPALRWIPAGDGLEISPLGIDLESERHSLLIRMQPGARIATHHHSGSETCFVVRGDLDDGRTRLRSGESARFEAGTRHSVTTRGGCTIFVTASLHDYAVS